MDSEFLEGTQEKRMFGIKYGQTKPTIDLISIALVAEDGREYYAISKDFNLKEAWNRWELKSMSSKGGIGDSRHKKEYWIRENVLFPIFVELQAKEAKVPEETIKKYMTGSVIDYPLFNYKYFRKLVNKYGKTNKQIAFQVVNFIHGYNDMGNWLGTTEEYYNTIIKTEPKDKPQFYGYFADYDWVVFCWLFGKMINLPKGFPMYCNDLKQEMDRKVDLFTRSDFFTAFDFLGEGLSELSLEEKIKHLKLHIRYPKKTNPHNALADSRFVRDLHEFLKTL